jgi:chromosome segregation ATPase
MNTTQSAERVQLVARNIGGIDQTEVELDSGVTILEGRNATNRTSLLQSIMAALGSDSVSLKGDADEGRVELSLAGQTYTRTLTRTDGTVVTGGDPYLDDPELANLFAFLLESNEARRAVARGDDLRDLIMEPVDTDAIRSEIDRLEREKQELDDEFDAIDERKRDLPDLEQERNRLESEIEAKRAELDETEAELESLDADPDESREDKAELDRKLDELGDVRSELEDVRFDIETQEDSLESLREERRELRNERDELPETPMGDVGDIDARIRELRERKRSLDSETTELQSAIEFNEELLDEADDSVLASLQTESGDGGSVTDQLLDDGDVTCWTCGSTVQRTQIESTLDRLRELRQETIDEVRSVEDEIAELSERKSDLEAEQQRRKRLDRKLARIEDEIDDREQTLADLRDRRDALTDDVSDLEDAVEELETKEYSDVLELHKEANQIEFELGRLENDLDGVTDEIESIERRLEERDELESEREAVRDELQELRTRIDRLEAEAVEEFNEHMAAVLDILEYANLERIWIERTERTVREGRRTVSKSAFDLHVVRQSESGATYEDTVDHLSESEREVTGLVFALAGYLVHEVYEVVPFVLLDSLEAVDSDRIARLVDYFREYADYLVVALLSEDAAALDDEYRRVTSI